MGYISEVCFGVQKQQEQEIDQIIKDEFSEKTFEKKHYNKVVCYHTPYIKWNSRFDGVRKLMEAIESDESNFMVALGEDNEIHSEFGDWWDFVQHESYLSW